jgi:c-di-GMP-binding flagellar brake protein YcgR
MSFLDTQPADIPPFEHAGPWTPFRVGDPRQMLGVLRDLCRLSLPVTLGGPGTPLVVAAIWSVDELHDNLSFSLPPEADAHIDHLVEAAEVWAAGYLDDTKVQFACTGLRVERSGKAFILRVDMPDIFYSMPRRAAVRVKRAAADAPVVQFNLSPGGIAAVRLRVMDISTDGCGLWIPTASELTLRPGTRVSGVHVLLDRGQAFVTDLMVQHLSHSIHAGRGLRIGCGWENLPEHAADILADWILHGRRRRELLSLDL